jgi:hypothetical protein
MRSSTGKCGNRPRSSFILSAIAAAAALAGCGGGGDDNDSARTGTLKLGVTDAPIDAADAVVIQFTGVELKPANGPAFSIDFAPKTIDVLGMQGTERAMLLDGETVPAGEYQWMRLKVNADPNATGDSHMVIGGAQCELRIPSGDETGLKLIRGFTVGVGTTTDFTIDFNLRKSIVQPPGQHTMMDTCGGQVYLLKPVLRVVDHLQVGSITGTVDPTLVGEQCTEASTLTQVAPGNVYLYGPYTAPPAPVPDDVDDNLADGLDPITWAAVKPDDLGNYTYTIGFVPAGDYVLAYTCSPDQPDIDADVADLPVGEDEGVTFVPEAGITATAVVNQAVTVDFNLPPP